MFKSGPFWCLDSRSDEVRVGGGECVVDGQAVAALGQQPVDLQLQLGARRGLEVPEAGGALCVGAPQRHGGPGGHGLVPVTVLREEEGEMRGKEGERERESVSEP